MVSGGYMRKIGSRELKNRLGTYLYAVKRGQSLVITDRGKPVAKLSPLESVESSVDTLEQSLKKLEEQGLIRVGKRPFAKFTPITSRGKSASQMIIEDRR
jgi:prevent-host-death family protein